MTTPLVTALKVYEGSWWKSFATFQIITFKFQLHLNLEIKRFYQRSNQFY